MCEENINYFADRSEVAHTAYLVRPSFNRPFPHARLLVGWSVGRLVLLRSAGRLNFKEKHQESYTSNREREGAFLKICNIPQNRLLLIVIYFSTLFRFIQGFPKKTPVSQKSKIFLIYSVMIRKVK